MTRNTAMPLQIARRLLIALAVVIGGYATLALIGGAIPSNGSWAPPRDGVRLFVESNGIHVGLVMPKVAAGVDWRSVARRGDIADPRYAGYDHVAIGWGERGFFLGTPTWADVKPATIIAAAIGSRATLIHFEHVPAPEVGDHVRMVILRPAEYRRLAAFIQASIAPDGARYKGYGSNDVFLQATGHYSAIATCNSWSGDALRHAGVRIGWWTPFPVGVMAWF